LVILCVCACVFIFAVVSEILGTPERHQERLMIRLDNGGEMEEKLLVDPDSEWEKKDGAIDRKYRILWKEPEKCDESVSLWDKPEQAQGKSPGSGSAATSSWDQVPEQDERPEGW
jgi:hypothetical protein